MSAPDFLIIGAMKCGTTTLAAQLGAQPGIFITTPKEPNFFSDDDVWAQGPDWYRGLFDAAAPGDLKGEASTHYTKLPTYPETLARLRAHVPSPKLVYLIRDPLDRLVSHYIHEWSMGQISVSIDQAISQHPELVAYGCYGMQLEPWVQAFGPDAVMVTTMTELSQRPQAVLEHVAAFVGYDGPVAWQHERARENVSAERIRPLPMHRLLVNNPVATTLRRTLVPRWLRDRIKSGRQMQDRPKISPDRRAALEQVFAEDFVRLTAITGARPDLAACYPFVPK